MNEKKSTLMLKYQKAKVKLLEYNIPKEEWPIFPLNYRDLAFPTVLIISSYAETINEKTDRPDAYAALKGCSEFYDAALQSREQIIHDIDFALSGAAAYFFLNDFGSAKVLWKSINANEIEDEARMNAYNVFSIAFSGWNSKKNYDYISKAIIAFWNDTNRESLEKSIDAYHKYIMDSDSPQTWFWGEITCAVANIIVDSAARILLPSFSNTDIKSWEEYFLRKNAINLLWPSQLLVGKSGILNGKSAVLQLPTGVGKTKSIEIIIWSMFLTGRGNKALIVAPLRSLCNEISYDMRRAFPDKVKLNEFSDVLADDFLNILLEKNEKQVLICTPEKLQYIFHHDSSFMKAIDLFIFDESHMFDDRSRGALYELLVTDIKMQIQPKQQMVLMSAVLPNADQITKWLLGEDGVLAYDSSIASTPKSIGFTDDKCQVHYYSGTNTEEDFFVPRTFCKTVLKLHGREKRPRMFPESAQDIALYYANILCKNGGVAIYFNQRKSIPKFFERLEELDGRDLKLTNIRNCSNVDELKRFQKLYHAYYGDDSAYSKTVKLGILPHYSSLPNGIKIATEYAFRKNMVNVVACTSTLAQGVNIPIKYLLITGTNFSANQMSVRNFQNLIGRTGRSGVYTEGNVIVTSNSLYDERNKGKGYYKWKETRTLFDASSVEACSSAILNITKDFVVAYKSEIKGSMIIQYICDNIENDWKKGLLEVIIEECEKRDNEINITICRQELLERFETYKIAIDSIENEIVYMIAQQSISATPEELRNIATGVLNNTLAVYLASEEEIKLLNQLFNAICSKIEKQMETITKYSGIMIPLDMADIIIDWIDENRINVEYRSGKDLISLVEVLFRNIYPSLDIKEGFSFAWIQGYSFEQMSKRFDVKMNNVEKVCQYNLSYQMSFLVGNIIDLLDVDCINLEKLQLIQLALRYGVNTRTAISICEKVFYDRYLGNKIAEIIGDTGVNAEDITLVIKSRKAEIINLLQGYPSYFEEAIKGIL